MFCLPKEEATKFLSALRAGKIDPAKLADMSSAERRAFFDSIVGTENARQVNSLFESKLLLKNQQAGMVRWAEQVTGLSKKAKKDLLDRISELDEVLDPVEKRLFLEDLAAKKLGTDITFEEAQNIARLSKDASEAKASLDPNLPMRAPERLEYGAKRDAFQEYVTALKEPNRLTPFDGAFTSPARFVEVLAGAMKSVVASLDNSLVGRQGIKMLFTNPDIWSRAFLNTWKDMGKELLGIDAMSAIKADVYSRPNALNGKYEAGKYDLGLSTEEAFPTALPAKIPILGRLYKASESAFNGAALRMRADYADRMIQIGERNGLDMTDPTVARGVGRLVNSMTGRGDIGVFEPASRPINVFLFSAKFLKSNIDTLTAHVFDKSVPRFAKIEAAKNLVRIVGGMAAVLALADQMYPGSVDWDPRSANFGKIKIGNTRFDISGGMSSLVTLAARLATLSSKSSVTGKVKKLNSGDVLGRTGWDVWEDYWAGKLSPMFGLIRDYLKGEHFGGEKVTPTSIIKRAVTPISFQTAEDLLTTPNAAPFLAAMLAEFLGISATTYK